MRRRRLSTAMLFAALCAAIVIGATGSAGAADGADAAIVVTGNRHVDPAMIRSYFHRAPGQPFDAAALDAALKALYATGLFQDVRISRDGTRVLVNVAENATIGQIAFEGNKKLKDDDLKKVVQSKAGGPLWRPLVQGDVERLIELYQQHGYFGVHIDPQMIEIKGATADAKPASSGDKHGRGQRMGADDDHRGAPDAGKGGERVNLVFAIKEGDKLAVRKVLFAGNNAFPRNKLTGVIKSGQTNFLSFLLDNDIYDADKIANDCELLRQFYLDHGYPDVSVRSGASYDAASKGVVLTYVIEEGPPYRVGKVDIESGMKSVDASSLRSYLRTQPGDIFDAAAVDKSVDDLSMELARSGEPFASVFARKDRIPPSGPQARQGATGVVNLVYTIELGKRLYVERIDIHGDLKTHDDVIRRHFDFGEGDAYNRVLVDRAERRLKALGYFKSVKISVQSGSAPDRIVLDVALQEQNTGNFSISGGYSTSAGWMAEVGVSDSNFLGIGDIAKAKVTYGEYARGLDLGFTDPYFLGQRLAVGGELFGNETFGNVNQSYDSTVYGARLSLGTPLTDQFGVTWTYSIYNQAVALDPAEGISSLPIQQAAAQGPIWVSSIGSGVTYSTLDNPKDPTSGIRIQTNDELAGLGGAARFARTTEDVSYYHRIVGDVVGMVRAQGGYVTPWGGQQLPLLDGFFGGPNLIRGFAANGFGPRDITPGTTMDNLGGNVYWTTSAELEAPVPGVPSEANLKVALFSDVGSLWATGSSASSLASLSSSQSQQITNSSALRASVGTALIWDSPFGPLQVDYAYPVAKQPNDVTQRLNFTAGAF